VVREEEVVIVDEFTGRLAEGRRWREGVHQAIEAKEGLPISHASGDAARVTVQTFLRQYDRLAGMTGTARSATRELRSIYSARVAVIPTNRPSRRRSLKDRVLGHEKEKWRAIVEETRQVAATGRPPRADRC
jgi:preprotein translocase subunit SecA